MSEARKREAIENLERRQFLQRASVAAGAGTMGAGVLLGSTAVRAAHVSGNETLKVGLVGCGGRGTGAAVQALKADRGVELIAMGDLFPDKLQASLKRLQASPVASRVKVDSDHQFTGFDAYEGVIGSGVDVVLLASPPHFRPAHIEACIAAGKHVFAEKPIAVDAPGVRKVLDACAAARKKNLSVVSGLCWRYHFGARAAMERVHDGTIGDIVAVETTYNASRPGKPWPMVRKKEWSDLEFHIRNWYWLTWLSGDHIVEQAIHSLDKGAWVFHDEPPAAAIGLGGLQTRLDQPRGQIFDHHAVLFEFADGRRHFHYCRQMPGCFNQVATHVLGAKGTCGVERTGCRDMQGKSTWRYKGPKNVMHQTEHDEMYAALRAGKPINNGEYMCRSSMLAILGRMATYTGRRVTWEEALASTHRLGPSNYDWGQALPIPPVAVPGITEEA